MSATINFLANGFTISGGSGLGFFGTAFGNSINVGSFNQNTYITDGAGINQGPAGNNIQFYNGTSGYLGNNLVPTGLTYMPNNQATLNIRFNNDTAVQTTNYQLFIYDRINTNNPASGVVTYCAELVHVNPVANNTGSGSTTWFAFSGIASQTGIYMTLFNSPGQSGVYNNTSSTRPDTQHDSFLAITASPLSIGSKSQYGLYVSLQYLALLLSLGIDLF